MQKKYPAENIFYSLMDAFKKALGILQSKVIKMYFLIFTTLFFGFPSSTGIYHSSF